MKPKNFGVLKKRVDRAQAVLRGIEWLYYKEVQNIANRHQVFIGTGLASNIWQVHEYCEGPLGKLPMKHPAYAELDTLDAIVAELGIESTNLCRFPPVPKKKRK